MKKTNVATSFLLFVMAATTAFTTPAEEAAVKLRMQTIADATLSASVIVSIKPKLDGVEEPILAIESERCPNCGNYHSTDYSEYIEFEKSISFVGYALADDTVICRDNLINPENIDTIKVSRGDAVVGAQIHKIFTDQKAILLKLDAALPGIKPAIISPDAGKPESTVMATPDPIGLATELTAQASPSLGSPTRREEGSTQYVFENEVVLFDAAAKLCGFNFNARITGEENFNPAKWAGITPDAMLASAKKITAISALSTVPVKLNFRALKPKRSAPKNRWSSRDEDKKISELETVGTLISGTQLIIHLEDARNEIPRLEKIRVFFPDGTEDEADFVCVHKNVNILVAKLRKPRPENAIKLAKVQLPDYADKNLILIKTTSAGEGKTKIRSNRVRIQGLESGWRDLPTVDLPMKESAGDAIFNDAGEVLWITAVVIKASESIGRVERWKYNTRAMLMDATTFAKLATPEAKDMDLASKPTDADSDGAIGWIGLDLQQLDEELAEAMKVITETENGKFGAIVVNVQPGSSADKAGVKKGWILLSVKAENSTPMKIVITDAGSSSPFGGRFPWDRLGEIPAQYFDSIPTPWPAVKNDFTVQLLRMGIGSKIQADFIADGQKISKELEIETSPKYYENAATFKWTVAGISVCDMTFEVREYLNLADDAPGVVVCKIETSGKAVVSGIKPFEIITQVNGTPVKSVSEFEAIVKNTTEFKLDVLRMTNTRVVQFTLPGDTETVVDKAENTDSTDSADDEG